MRSAIIRREWRAFDNLKSLKSKVFTKLLQIPQEDEPEEEEVEPVNKSKLEPEKLEDINNLAKTGEQIEKYLIMMKERTGDEFGIT